MQLKLLPSEWSGRRLRGLAGNQCAPSSIIVHWQVWRWWKSSSVSMVSCCLPFKPVHTSCATLSLLKPHAEYRQAVLEVTNVGFSTVETVQYLYTFSLLVRFGRLGSRHSGSTWERCCWSVVFVKVIRQSYGASLFPVLMRDPCQSLLISTIQAQRLLVRHVARMDWICLYTFRSFHVWIIAIIIKGSFWFAFLISVDFSKYCLHNKG